MLKNRDPEPVPEYVTKGKYRAVITAGEDSAEAVFEVK